nr:hypothetical protein [Burkholderia cepacia]
MKGIDAEEAGRYRRENVVIAGASTTPPDFMHLPAEMAALIDWYEAAWRHASGRAGGGTAHAIREDPSVH